MVYVLPYPLFLLHDDALFLAICFPQSDEAGRSLVPHDNPKLRELRKAYRFSEGNKAFIPALD